MNESRRDWKNKPLLDRLRGFEHMALDHICVEAANEIDSLNIECCAFIDQIAALISAVEYWGRLYAEEAHKKNVLLEEVSRLAADNKLFRDKVDNYELGF